MVEYGTLLGPVDKNHPAMLDANMQLFDTIAHEGYHAYQNYAIEHPGFHKDVKQVKEWAINDENVKIFDEGDEYLVQPQERDAWKYGSEKTREAFDEIEKYYGAEPGRAMYEKSVEDNSYENALERLWNNNPDGLNQMYKEMMDAYEERYRENNSTVNLDSITVDEYDAISREAVNRYYEHLKNNPSLSNEEVMRMTGEMSEKYFSAVEEYKNAVQQKEKSEDRVEKENRTEKYEAQNQENRSIFNSDRVSVEEYDKTLRDQVNKYYEHLKNDPSLSNEDVMRMTEEMSEKYLTAVEEYRNAQKQEDEGFQEKSGDKESTENRYKRYKKEEIEKENPEHKRDVENQRKEEAEEENKSEKTDKLENREDGKDCEEGGENKDKTETLSEDELEEERWNESESEDEAELLSDKAEAEEEQNTEDKAVTENESELQDNAADLSSEESSGETEDNSETEDNVEDLSSEESSEETEEESEEESEEEDKAEDLSSEESTEETEEESEEEDKAEDLSSEENSGKIEEESEEEDEAKDLSSEENSEETEEESEEEDKAEDLSSGEDDSTSYESGGSEETENYSY